jgi:hypothetical protein
MEDVHHVDSLKPKYGSQFLWFKRGSKEYVITDASTLKAIDAFQAPQIALAHQQAELGKKQGALAHQQEQSKLAKQQAEIWRQVEEKIAQTLETAMANGIAKPVTP